MKKKKKLQYSLCARCKKSGLYIKRLRKRSVFSRDAEDTTYKPALFRLILDPDHAILLNASRVIERDNVNTLYRS